MFMLGLLTMNAEGDQNFDITIGNPLAVQAFYQKREVYLTAGVTGDVGGDDDHLLSRPETAKKVLTDIQRGFDYICG